MKSIEMFMLIPPSNIREFEIEFRCFLAGSLQLIVKIRFFKMLYFVLITAHNHHIIMT